MRLKTSRFDLQLGLLSALAYSSLTFAVDNYANALYAPILESQCLYASQRVKSEYQSVSSNLTYMIVRNHGDEGTDERIFQAANAVSYDVSVFSGYQPPYLPYYGYRSSQRGYYDLAYPDGSSAVQVHCHDAGFVISTYHFTHTEAIMGGGPHVAYETIFSPTRAVFNDSTSELTLQSYVRLPWFLDVDDGIGNICYYVKWEDTTTNLRFFQLVQIFDTRPWGDGNGIEFVSYDPASELAFASSPLKSTDRYGNSVQSVTISPYSQSMKNDTTWSTLKFFRAHVSQDNLSNLIDDIRTTFPGAYGDLSTDPTDYELYSAGLMAEVILPDTTDEISLGGSFRYFEVYEAYEQ